MTKFNSIYCNQYEKEYVFDKFESENVEKAYKNLWHEGKHIFVALKTNTETYHLCEECWNKFEKTLKI